MLSVSIITYTVYPTAAGEVGGGISREDFIAKIATDVLTKLPEEFDLDFIKKKYGSEVSPTTVVLLQEVERFNKLINRMHRSLVTLKKVRFAYLRRHLGF